ncbi:MAG: cytochrome c oxidase subunit 3 [Terriglobales bacterium]
MATLNPTIVEERRPQPGGGGGAPPHGGEGGGGDGRDDGRNDFGSRLRRNRIGMAVALAPVAMLFVAFTSAYIVRQGLGEDWRSMVLPRILWINTAILLASSVTLELARRGLTRQAALAELPSVPGVAPVKAPAAPWLAITLVLGLGFLAGQWVAWSQLARQGIFISSNPSSSFFYLLTGAHAVHLAGGVLALLYAAATAVRSHAWEKRRMVVDVTSWYWHFMALLWIYIFALLQLAK